MGGVTEVNAFKRELCKLMKDENTSNLVFVAAAIYLNFHA